MGKGKRYDEPKLNLKKVFGTIITVIVFIMVVITINKILSKEAEKIQTEKLTFISAYQNGKWGVINNKGELVVDTTYDEMITIPNPEKPIFVCTYNVNDDTGEYKTNVINNKGEELFKDYDKVEIIENFDSKQNIWYEKNLLRVIRNGKYGLIDLDGKEIIDCTYDNITTLKGVEENLVVKKDNLVGVINNIGQTIVPVEYSDIKTLKEGYKNEYIIVDENGKSGIISTSGTVIVEPTYSEIKYINSNELYAVKIDDKWNLINKKGEILNNSYDDYSYVKGDYVIVQKDGKYGIITTAGDVKIPATYEDLQYAFSVYYIAKSDSKYGIINTDNIVQIPIEYSSMTYWEEKDIIIADKTETETVIFDSNLTQKLNGIFVFEDEFIKARINGQDKYYTYKFEEKQTRDILTKNTLFVTKQDGKYGYVDSQGNLVVKCIYDEAKEQNQFGYSAIKQNGLWGSIDKGGKVVLQPQVNLDNSIYVDFIGEWHLADEGFYYTK